MAPTSSTLPPHVARRAAAVRGSTLRSTARRLPFVALALTVAHTGAAPMALGARNRTTTKRPQSAAQVAVAPVAAPMTAAVSATITQLRFDGKSEADAVAAIERAEGVQVVASGTIRVKGVLRQGELWVVVHKDKKDVYYHLSEIKQSSGASFAGYRILVKAVTTSTFYAPGTTHEVPLVGRTSDAHLSLEMRLSVNSMFFASSASSTPARGTAVAVITTAPTRAAKRRTTVPRNARTATANSAGAAAGAGAGAGAAGANAAASSGGATSLIDKGSMVMTLALSGSAVRTIVQGVTAIGQPIGSPTVVPGANMPYGGSTNCAAAGETAIAGFKWAGEINKAGQDTMLSVLATGVALANLPATGAAAGGAGAAAGGAGAAASGAGAMASGAARLLAPYLAVGRALPKFLIQAPVDEFTKLGSPLVAAAAVTTCEMLSSNTTRPSITAPPTLPGATIPPLAGSGEFGCLRYTEVHSSYLEVTGDDAVTVHGVTHLYCEEYGWVGESRP